MDSGTSDDALSDRTLDLDLERALAIDPSPGFVARIRARVALEPAPSAGWYTWRFAGATAACVTVAVLAVFTWWERGSAPGASTVERAVSTTVGRPQPLAGPESRTRPTITSAGSADTSADKPVSLPVSRPRVVLTVRKAEPAVVISEDEATALRQLFRDVSSGRVDLTAWPVAQPTAEPLTPIREIAIEPISVSSLAPIGE